MNDDALMREWQTGDGRTVGSVRKALETVLEKDRGTRQSERLIRLLSIGCVAVLAPLLVWAAANAVTPLVRGGYALMALGVAVMLFGELTYSSWNRKAQPGASDSLTQIGTTIAMTRQQAMLMRSGAVWCAPIFVGAGMVGGWIYVERSQSIAITLWLAVAVMWMLTAISGHHRARDLEVRRSRLEAVLNDFRS